MTGAAIRRKPSKEIVVDGSITRIIMKRTFAVVQIEDEETAKTYRLQRTPIKKGLQMTGV